MSYDNIAYQAVNETLMQIAAGGAEVTEQMQQVVLEEAQAKFGDKLRDLDYLTKLTAPVYAKYFDEKEMDAMVEFWSRRPDARVSETSGQMNQDSLVAIQEVTFRITPPTTSRSTPVSRTRLRLSSPRQRSELSRCPPRRSTRPRAPGRLTPFERSSNKRAAPHSGSEKPVTSPSASAQLRQSRPSDR